MLAACLALLTVGSAQAALTLEVGSANFMSINNETGEHYYGGGSFDPAKLNGNNLPYLYCVDLTLSHAIGTPGTYFATYNTGGTTADNPGLDSLVATRIAWLLTEYATDADVDERALQASIWNQLNNNWTMLDEDGQGDAYDKYVLYKDALANAGITTPNTGLIDNFYWISPTVMDTGAIRQGMVTATPIPGTLMLLGSGLGGLVGIARFRRKRSAN